MRVAGPILSLLACLAGASTLSAGEPASPMAAIERAAPEKCLFYFGSPGLPVPNAQSTNHAEQLLANAGIRRFGEDAKTLIETYFSLFTSLNDDEHGLGACWEHILDLAFDVALTHPVGFFIEWPANVGGQNPSPALAVILHCGDRADDVRKVAREFADAIRLELADTTDESAKESFKVETKEDDAAIEDDFHLLIDADGFRAETSLRGEYLVWTLDNLTTADVFARLQGTAAPPKWLAALKDRAASKRVGTISYLGGAEIGGAFGRQRRHPLVAMLSPFGIDESVVSALGIDKFVAAGAVGALDEEGVVTREFIDLGGWPTEWPPQKPLSADDLKPIPDNADFAAIGRFDARWLFRQLLVALDQIPGVEFVDADGNVGSEPGFPRYLMKLEEQLGFGIEDDFLAALGDVWTLHSSPGGGLIPGNGLVFTAALRDEKKLAKIQEGLTKFLSEQISGDDGSPAGIEAEQFKGIEIHHLKVVGTMTVGPAWAVVGSRLVVAATLQGMKFHISRGGKQSLAELPAIAKRLEGGPVGLVYGNTASAARQLTAAYELFGPTLIGALEDFEVDVELPKLPEIESIEPHLLPQIVTVHRSAAGFEVESFATVPQITLTSTIGLLWCLPDIVDLPVNAEPGMVLSGNNLAEIGQAMAAYHDEFKSFPAAAICDAQGKPLLSWRVKLLPFLGDDAAALYKEFHLDEPWDSEHNQPLLAKMPAVYKDASAGDLEDQTVYLVPTGEDTMFNGNIPASLRTATDGPDHTILVIHVAPEKSVPWTKPEDLKIDPEHPLANLGRPQTGMVFVLAVDGAVHSLSADIDPEVLWGFFTRAGGEHDAFPDSGFMFIDE